MLPRLPLVGLPTYGFLLALGFCAALLLLGRTARMAGLSPRVAQDVVLWASLWGLGGAKLLLLVVAPAEFLHAPWRLLMVGGVFYGGLIGAVGSVVWQCRKRGLRPFALGDACAPAIALGHAFGRVGCLMAGCCFGRPTTLPWGVSYVHHDAACWATDAYAGGLVHPVQAYESLVNLALCGLLLLVLARRRFEGMAWWTWVAGYGTARFVLEFFRGDPRGSILGGRLSTSQAIAAVGVPVALGALAWGLVRSRTPREGPP